MILVIEGKEAIAIFNEKGEEMKELLMNRIIQDRNKLYICPNNRMQWASTTFQVGVLFSSIPILPSKWEIIVLRHYTGDSSPDFLISLRKRLFFEFRYSFIVYQ